MGGLCIVMISMQANLKLSKLLLWGQEVMHRAVPMFRVAIAKEMPIENGSMIGALTTRPMPISVELHCMKHAKKPVVVDVVSNTKDANGRCAGAGLYHLSKDTT